MLRARCYAAWDAGLLRLRSGLNGLNAVQQGFWLGFLDNLHLDELGPLQYARWAKYGEENYNLSGLQQWEERILTSYFRPACSILVAAAGGGRESIALARMGYRVDSFDCTPRLTKSHRLLMDREVLPGKVLLATAGSVPDQIDVRYDGLIVGWGGYMHVAGRGNRVSFLSALRRHVAAGAPLLLSFFCRRERSRHLDWIYAVARLVRKLRGSGDPVEYGDALAGTFDHYFTEAEIQAELAAAGFELIDYDEAPYGHAIGRAF